MADLFTLTMAIGTVVKTAGTLIGGAMAKQAAEYEAEQYRRNALQARAAAQRQAFEQRRKKELALSALQARAAASGAGADDPTIITLAERIAGRGEYLALTEMFAGEEEARGMAGKAQAAEFRGEMRQLGSFFDAAGTILGGGASMYKLYRDEF